MGLPGPPGQYRREAPVPSPVPPPPKWGGGHGAQSGGIPWSETPGKGCAVAAGGPGGSPTVVPASPARVASAGHRRRSPGRDAGCDRRRGDWRVPRPFRLFAARACSEPPGPTRVCPKLGSGPASDRRPGSSSARVGTGNRRPSRANRCQPRAADWRLRRSSEGARACSTGPFDTCGAVRGCARKGRGALELEVLNRPEFPRYPTIATGSDVVSPNRAFAYRDRATKNH
jgi:hypothetical protein